MRIGILTQWFDPETGPASVPAVLARSLAQRGHDVQVVTGYPNYPTGELYDGYRIRLLEDTRQDGYSLRRVALYPSHSNRATGRIANYLSFAASATFMGTDRLLDVDALWVYNSPATVAFPMWTAQCLGRVPVVLHNMDMWPDAVFHAGFSPNRGARLLRGALNAWVNQMYRSATFVAYLSPAAGRELEHRGVPDHKLAYAPVWIDETVFHPADGGQLRDSLGYKPDDIVVSYAGALGKAQGITNLVRAVVQLPADSRIRCLILGSGTEQDEISRLATTHPRRVKYVGQVAQQEMTTYAAVADVAYVGLAQTPESEFAAPSKVPAIMATGRPILAAATGDTASLVTGSGAGWLATPDDVTSIADRLSEIADLQRDHLNSLGEVARRFYLENLSARTGVDRVQGLLQEAVRRRAAASTRPRHRQSRAGYPLSRRIIASARSRDPLP